MTEVGGAVAIVLFRRDGELLEMSLQKNVHSEKIPFGCHVGHHPHTCPCWDPVPPWKWTLKGLRKEDVDVAQISSNSVPKDRETEIMAWIVVMPMVQSD